MFITLRQYIFFHTTFPKEAYVNFIFYLFSFQFLRRFLRKMFLFFVFKSWNIYFLTRCRWWLPLLLLVYIYFSFCVSIHISISFFCFSLFYLPLSFLPASLFSFCTSSFFLPLLLLSASHFSFSLSFLWVRVWGSSGISTFKFCLQVPAYIFSTRIRKVCLLHFYGFFSRFCSSFFVWVCGLLGSFCV